MNNFPRLAPLWMLLPVAGLQAADPLDFADAKFKVTIDNHSTVVEAAAPAMERQIDGKQARTGRILSNALKVDWLIAPSPEVGDEYVFIVRRPKEKPMTYSVVFKGGHAQILRQPGLTIEIEN